MRAICGQLRADLEQLVDLLLVFDDRVPHLGVVDREDELGARRVLVERHRHRAERLHASIVAYSRGRFSPTTTTWSSRTHPASARPQAMRRTIAASAAHVVVCQMPSTFTRRAGAWGAGCVVEHEAGERRLHRVVSCARGPAGPLSSLAAHYLSGGLTPGCRCDDNCRVFTRRLAPRPLRTCRPWRSASFPQPPGPARCGLPARARLDPRNCGTSRGCAGSMRSSASGSWPTCAWSPSSRAKWYAASGGP